MSWRPVSRGKRSAAMISSPNYGLSFQMYMTETLGVKLTGINTPSQCSLDTRQTIDDFSGSSESEMLARIDTAFKTRAYLVPPVFAAYSIRVCPLWLNFPIKGVNRL